MKQAIEYHEKDEAIVIPILLRDCDWTIAPFADIQGFPTDMCPVTAFGRSRCGVDQCSEGYSKARRITEE